MRELSLAISTPDGLVVVAGCSHPGIGQYLQWAGVDHCVYAGLGTILKLARTGEAAKMP